MFLPAVPSPVRDLAYEICEEERHNLDRTSGSSRQAAEEAESDPAMLNNWLRRTGWQATFAGTRRDVLVSLSELPGVPPRELPLGTHDGAALVSPAWDERKLAMISAAVDRLLDCCADTVRHTDVSIRRWLRSALPDRPYKAPFELVSRASSEHMHRNELKRRACFWLRVLRFPGLAACAVMRCGLSKGQQLALEELWSDRVWERMRPPGRAPIWDLCQ